MIQLTTPRSQLLLDGLQVFTAALTRLQEQIGEHALPKRDERFHELSQAIRTMSRKCRLAQQSCEDPHQLEDDRRYFQNCIAPWFETSWFMSRAKQKPRGYPGDYELLSGIYAGQPRSTGLGGYLDLYFLHSDLGQAVVARMHAAREFLNEQARQRDGDLTILNVASGPCREFFTGLSMPQHNRTITVCCIDNDVDALDFVQGQLATHAPTGLPQLRFVPYNALRMRSAKSNVARFGLADIIYSIGLLDYLPDKHLIATMRGLRDTLKPGGVAYFAFKDTNGYDHHEYQWFVDWFFFQRDEQQCRDLLLAAGFLPQELSVRRDDTGIIMNFVATVDPRFSCQTDHAGRQASLEAPRGGLPLRTDVLDEAGAHVPHVGRHRTVGSVERRSD